MEYNTKILVIVCTVISLYGIQVYCQGEINLEELKSKLPEGVEIPPALQNISLPTMEEIKAVVKSKCDKVTGNTTAFTAVEEAFEEFKGCAADLVDFEELQKEMEDAQPKGELDTVFNKYCRKRNATIDCLKNLTQKMEPCLVPKEIDGEQTVIKIFTNLLNFVCHKDGDQIALFVAEKGPECFKAKQNKLIECVNSTFSKYATPENEKRFKNITSATVLPEFIISTDQCNDMNNLQNCIVGELEVCEESTPANLVESMFKFIRNETPCVNVTVPPRKPKTPNSGSRSLSNFFLGGILTIVSIGLLNH